MHNSLVSIEFWKKVPKETYPKLVNEMLKLCSLFGNTVMCERYFSVMKNIKTPQRNRLSDEMLEDTIRISVSTKENIDFDKLTSEFKSGLELN